MKYLFTFLFVFALYSGFSQQTISGYIKDSVTEELLPGATVFIQNSQNGTVTNKYGFYSLTFTEEKPVLVVQYIGYKPILQEIENKTQTKDFYLEIQGGEIEGVVIDVGKEDIIETPQMSKIQIEIEDIKNTPALLGEKDVLKTLQLMPGVQSGSEGQSGFYVRGGGPDQNLIILDEAPVYNASHLFGFFSLFNGDALKSVDLVKGGFPARYGGRLSSVVDMTAKDGSRDHITGSAKVGILSTSGVLEGPISKKKKNSSFMLSGRRTYADIFTRILSKAQSDGQESAGYYFYDLIAKGNYDIDEKNRVYLSGYFGRDNIGYNFNDADDTEKVKFGWGNATGTARWNHVFSPKLFSNASIIFSHYDFGIDFKEEYENQKYRLKYSSGIEDIGFKYDLDFFPNSNHAVRAGVQTTRHHFRPRARVELDSQLGVDSKETETYISLENAAYVEDEWSISNHFKANLGLRFSHYLEDEVNYARLEPRLSIAYKANETTSLKASYSEMNQYIHLLTNTGASLPTDLWVPSTDIVKPQFARQFAVGLAKMLKDDAYQLTLEGYHKSMENIIGYKEGSTLVNFEAIEDGASSSNDWQKAITPGTGTSYGAELLLRKNEGKLHGWTGYTWSKTEHQFDELNHGQPFSPKYDRRHDLSIVGFYDIAKNKTLMATFVYGTGQAISLQRAEYQEVNHNPFYPEPRNPTSSTTIDFGTKNSSRMEDYHRLDVSYRFEKEKRKGRKAWEFGVYNIYNRGNPFFYYVEEKNNKYTLKNASLFHLLPSISWSYQFK